MKPPRRLLEGPLTTAERRALTAGLSLAAPKANKERIWASLGVGAGTGVAVATAQAATGSAGALTVTSQLGSPVVTALTNGVAAAGTAAKTAPLWPTLVKTLATWTLVGSGVGVAAKLGLQELPLLGATSPQAAPATTASPSNDGRARAAGGMGGQHRSSAGGLSNSSDRAGSTSRDGVEPSPQGQPRAFSKPATRAATAATLAASSARPASEADSPGVRAPGQTLALERESQLVALARARLRSGQPGDCLGLLAQANAQFPRGWLQQERRALSIEAHAALGQAEQVRRLAREFVSDYPESPYAAKVTEMARQ